MHEPTSLSPTPHDELAPRPSNVAEALVAALRALGVRDAFGVMGGAIAPFFHALSRSSIRYFHMRHECGAAFAALEASLATRRPVLLFTTAGPGLTNALTGLLAARWEGAHVILVSAATSSSQRGRIATQETSVATVGGAGVLLPGGALHHAITIEHPAQLGPLVAQLGAGFERPGGFVAHVSLPIDVQGAPCGPLRLVQRGAATAMCAPEVIAHHAELLAHAPLTMWVGFGARHAAREVRRLAERTGARVMCTPRGKGIFPESHPQFLGVTGIGGHQEVDALVAADRTPYTLVLGTRLGESSSFWTPALVPSEAFLHVDLDATAFGAAYPDARTYGAVADIGRYCDALVDALGAREIPAARTAPRAPVALDDRDEGLVRPQRLFAELQRQVVDGSDAWLMAESGNAFCWAVNLLRPDAPGRVRVSTGFGSMGHATTSVTGVALARHGKAVAVVGDGAMMMSNELHSAVQHRADAVWVVLNDAQYLMCAQGMTAMGWEPFSCDMPRVDFVALARAVGADGERVTRECDLAGAIERAMRASGPWVVDVAIDPHDVPPSGRRNRSLMQQGHAADARRRAGESQ